MSGETNNPTISVVIPIYDREKELLQSIESILNQTYQDFELLLICDGSPSGTIQIVNEFINHPKVRIFKYGDNSGNAVRGRNKGIQEARGQYVAFQDSDDISEPNRLELSLKFIEEFKCDVVHGGWRAMIDGSRKVHGLQNGHEVIWPDVDLDMLKKPSYLVCQSSVMCQTNALRTVGGVKREMFYLEDYELWLRLLYNGYKFKSIPHVLVNLRLWSGNLQPTFLHEANNWLNLALKEYKIIRPLRVEKADFEYTGIVKSIPTSTLPIGMQHIAQDFIENHNEITGFFDDLRLNQNFIIASGWARNPLTGLAAEEVIIVNQEKMVVAYSKVGLERPDVVIATGDGCLKFSGWSVKFSKNKLPKDINCFHAFLLCDNRKKAIKLRGDFSTAITVYDCGI